MVNKITNLNTINDFIAFATRQFIRHKVFFGHGTDNARDEAIYLIFHTLNLPFTVKQAVLKRKLKDSEKKAILKIIDKRIQNRVPAAYLTTESWFAGLPFYVNKKVLIPRSPLAELIAKQFVPWVDPKKVTKILDIGTGSGCIAIAAAYAFKKAKIDAVDVSVNALKIAKINCVKHRVTNRINLLKSNLFTNLQGRTYDIIISNPPYVGKAEMESLPKEYYHEPKQALFAGKYGDEIVNKIIKNAEKYLKPKGILVVEVGNSAALIMGKYPHLPFIWLEFEHGEAEVFLLTKEQLRSALATT